MRDGLRVERFSRAPVGSRSVFPYGCAKSGGCGRSHHPLDTLPASRCWGIVVLIWVSDTVFLTVILQRVAPTQPAWEIYKVAGFIVADLLGARWLLAKLLIRLEARPEK
jgi:hypothetical protein